MLLYEIAERTLEVDDFCSFVILIIHLAAQGQRWTLYMILTTPLLKFVPKAIRRLLTTLGIKAYPIAKLDMNQERFSFFAHRLTSFGILGPYFYCED